MRFEGVAVDREFVYFIIRIIGDYFLILLFVLKY